MRKKPKDGSNLKYAFYFIILVVFLGGISLTFKLAAVLKNSTFDGNHRYNLEFKKGNNLSIASFSPETNSISIVDVGGKVEDSVNKSLSVPIDGLVGRDRPINSSNIFYSIAGVFPETLTANSRPTFVDIVRLMMFARSVPKESITEKTINVSSDDLSKQQLLSPLFLDQSISDEKKTIEIINSTQTSGLGARLAILLNNIGANIILVVTSEKPQKESQINYYNQESYTVSRISSILGFKKIQSRGSSIADVIIIIGEDQANTVKF